MSQRIKVSSLGWDDLTKEVPSTNEEYNALDPKRENAVLEDAVDNVMKHTVLSRFRDKALDALGAVEPKIERINHGTDDAPQWESDAKYKNRIMVARITAAGGSPTDAAVVAKWHADTLTTVQTILDGVKFTVAGAVRSGTAPQKVGKQDLATAQDAIDKGLAEKFAALLGGYLGRTVGTSQDELAAAIKDRRAKKVAEDAAAQKSELAALA